MGLSYFFKKITAIQKDPEVEKEVDALIALGDARGRIGHMWEKSDGEYSYSLWAYDKALSLDPTNVKAWIGKGNSLSALGRHDEAYEAYTIALTCGPQTAEAWVGKGNSLIGLNRYSEALEAFNKAIKLDQKNSDAWFGKSAVYNIQHQYKEALEALNKAEDCGANVTVYKKVVLGKINSK